MPLLADEDANYLRESFADLPAEVSLTVITRQRSRLVLPGAAADGPEDSSAEVRHEQLGELHGIGA